MGGILVKQLSQLPRSQWLGSPGASEQALRAIEARHGLELPEDHRELFRFSDGGHLYGHLVKLALWSTEEVLWFNTEARFTDPLPGMFVFGTDEGDCVFYYDPKGSLGFGAYAVFMVDTGALALELSSYVGRTLTDLFDAVRADEDLWERPRLAATRP